MKEKYQFIGNWGLKENKGKAIIRVEDINPWEFRGYFEGLEEINTQGKPYNFLFVFQYKDVKRIKEK